jgi:EAL domain-containing protein (putative c-di-GMP-specific phosphodiesterase class I)
VTALVAEFDESPSGSSGRSDSGEVQRLLELARRHLGMELAWMSEFNGGQQVVTAVSGDAAAMNVRPDQGTPLEGSYCIRVLAGALPSAITDARRHLVTRDLPVTHDLSIGSYVGAPWLNASGEVAGMLCVLSRTANPGLDEQSARFLALLADLIGDQMRSPAARDRHATRQTTDRIRGILIDQDVEMVFQPVVRLHDGATLAYEALARFQHAGFDSPAHAFAAATRAGLGPQLEWCAARRALARLDDMPAGTWLGVNLSAEALLTPETQNLLHQYAGRNIGVELTEHTPVADYQALTAVTDQLRREGIQIVVDDAGAGFASLNHILQLHPDVIKLDIALTRGIDVDPVRQALTRSLVAFAHDIDAHLIAEGIETSGEHTTLQHLGVRLGQGYLMARPGALPT